VGISEGAGGGKTGSGPTPAENGSRAMSAQPVSTIRKTREKDQRTGASQRGLDAPARYFVPRFFR
jgi:hypothetical protein